MWQGEKIRLRAVKASDLEEYFLKENQQETEDMRAGDRVIFPKGESLMQARVEALSSANPFEEEFFLIIEDKEGTPVGNINTHSCNQIDGVFQYGLGIRTPYRGKGYAKESIGMVIDYYFNELRYRKAEAHVYSFNEASIKLHESLGFTKEGQLRKSHFTKGKYWDVLIYGLLKEEYE